MAWFSHKILFTAVFLDWFRKKIKDSKCEEDLVHRGCLKWPCVKILGKIQRPLRDWGCEMKICPAILINKKCHRHQRSLASKCEYELPKLRSPGCFQSPHQPPPPQWLLRSWGHEKSKMNKKMGWPQIVRYIWKEWIQWSQRLASSHIQNAKFLNLISDLWCSDCLLSLLQTCI